LIDNSNDQHCNVIGNRLHKILHQHDIVGRGQVLPDILASGAVPVVRLIEVSAHRINQGFMPDLSKPEGESDFYFANAKYPETAVQLIVDLVKNRIPKRFGLDPIRDIQVLWPMNRGGVGAHSLNIGLQAALNPAGDRKVERFSWTFSTGDKIMQIEKDHDKEVYNDDIGYIDDVDPDSGELTASFRLKQSKAKKRGAKQVVADHADAAIDPETGEVLTT
jgi:exodeoxyribonuclease V alpha subunit